jgi:hypothetical protein
MKRLILIAMVVLLSTSIALAQNFCKGDFNYDGAVAADDVATFLEHFGRSPFNDPCPPDGPSPVPQTGQTTSYAAGDDGDHQRGVGLVTPRFTDNDDGTVTDNQTGLIWLKDANCFGPRPWSLALSDCNGLADPSCGLTDGSNAGEWRLPNYKELFSLVDANNYDPALPTGHPFTNVVSGGYSSSTTIAAINLGIWTLPMYHGIPNFGDKIEQHYYVWPVRGGH